MLNLSLSKLTGNSGTSGWSRVFEFRGELFVLVSSDFPYPELATKIEEEYFGHPEIKPFNAIRIAVEKANAEIPSSKEGVEIAALSYIDGVTYSAATGGAQVLIQRGQSSAPIISSKPGEVASASGFPKEGDKIIVGTKGFFAGNYQDLLKNDLRVETIEEQNAGRVGVMVATFSEKKEEIVEEQKPVETLPPTPLVPRPQSSSPGIFDRISRSFPPRKLFVKPPMGEDVESQANKKLTLSVGVILLVILTISIGFGIRQRGINKVRGQYEDKLSQASSEIDQAVSIAPTSPDKARELFGSSQDLLNQILALDVKDKRIDELKAKIDSERGSILGEYTSTPELFLDLGLLSSGFTGDAVSTSQGDIYILDKSGKKVVSIEISSKKSKVVAGPDKIDNPQGLAAYSGKVFILNDGGISEVDGISEENVVNKTWNGDALVYAYTGNLYVLDKSGNSVLRFAGSGSGSFGEESEWLSKDTTVDFSGAKSWIIDGAIYVLTSSGKIAKFSQGSPQNFNISGVYPAVENIDAIYTNEDNQDFYLLDSQSGRVVVVDKSGKYIAQYTSDEIKSAKGLVVSEADKKIILLTGSKLLSIDIKHLQ